MFDIDIIGDQIDPSWIFLKTSSEQSLGLLTIGEELK